MEKTSLVGKLSEELLLPIKDMNTFQVGDFSALMARFGTTDLKALPGNPEYEQIIEKGLILRYKELRYYNNEPYGYHWGIDVMSCEGTPVYAAADGMVKWIEKVSSLTPNYGGETYGNFIVLEHVFDFEKVYTLYGHLADLSGTLKRGERVKKGHQVGVIGKAFTVENGGWPPHLHFQIGLSIIGLEAYGGLELQKETVNPLDVFGLSQ